MKKRYFTQIKCVGRNISFLVRPRVKTFEFQQCCSGIQPTLVVTDTLETRFVVVVVVVVVVVAVVGSRGGVVMRALASHQCGPGSIPGPDVICGSSLLGFVYLQ